mgnify:FL=1
MNNNVEVKNSQKQGNGVFACRDFLKDDFVLAIDDSHIVTDESKLTKEQYESHCDYLADKVVLMQEPEVYINHSCDPNVYVKTEGGIRNVYALRDIKEGEEITYDYSVNGDNDGVFECNCGSKNCRGVYQGNFFKLPIEIQLRYLPYLDDWFVEKHKEKIEGLKANN